MLSGLVTAMRTLTILSVPGKDTEHFSTSLFWFPVVGLLLGFMEAAVAYTVMLIAWHELAAALVVLCGMALTRGMHADGFADMADGFWGGKTKESALRIMKDPNVGSFGAIALSGLMLLKWIALFKLITLGAFPLIVAGVLLARWVQVLLAASLPYARSEGGTAQSFVRGAGTTHIIVTSIVALSLLIPLLSFIFHTIAIVIVAALFAGAVIGMLSYRKIGGVTGDVLGAVSEMVEVVVWIAGAVSIIVFS